MSVRRRFLARVALCAVLVSAAGVWGNPAQAAGAPPSSTGQRWALVSQGNNQYVAAEINDSGSHNGMLRARSTSVGTWETFTLHTTDYGATATLRSEANGLYVAAEIDDSGADRGMLRARSSRVGSWEQFTLVPAGTNLYALRSKANGLYVSAELSYTGNTYGMLRARASSVGSWERFRLVPLAGAGSPPTAAPAGTDRVSVMSWNVCSNNSACPLYRARSSTIANTITYWATQSFSPDALFLQEFCEKDAKPLEYALENATGRGWDVRFAPIQYIVDGTSLRAQKVCVSDLDGVDRGSYGIALALPDVNVWYTSYPLTSPPGYEQRTVLCAVLESRALNFCNTHFSSSGRDDDPDGTYRAQQVTELLSRVDKPGYRAIFGGDLNLTPDRLGAVYDRYRECDQSTPDDRSGRPTAGSYKIDYIFGPLSATYQCRVTSTSDSDHRPIYAIISLASA